MGGDSTFVQTSFGMLSEKTEWVELIVLVGCAVTYSVKKGEVTLRGEGGTAFELEAVEVHVIVPSLRLLHSGSTPSESVASVVGAAPVVGHIPAEGVLKVSDIVGVDCIVSIEVLVVSEVLVVGLFAVAGAVVDGVLGISIAFDMALGVDEVVVTGRAVVG